MSAKNATPTFPAGVQIILEMEMGCTEKSMVTAGL
jgi:hypothetical protein